MKPLGSRIRWLGIGLLVVFVAVFVRLYAMMIIQHDDYVAKATGSTTKTITLFGKRGTIYDCDYDVLAYDAVSYNVTFYRDPANASSAYRKMYTDNLVRAIEMIENKGSETVNDFWLKKDEDGKWHFDTGSGSESVEASRERSWRQNFYLTKTDESELYSSLCTKYHIPEDMDPDLQVKVLALWQESRMSAYLSTPVVIAYNVSYETMCEIEAAGLTGIGVEQSFSRVYPQGRTACHIVGYVGGINSSRIGDYVAQGYPRNAKVGISGIEYSFESYLSQYTEARQGYRIVEVNSSGAIIRELAYKAPTDGSDVVLNIDIDLQNVMADALQNAITDINGQQVDVMATERWQKNNADELAYYDANEIDVKLAETGALIAMNPNNGKVLGMVSIPDFDLSLFNGGLITMPKWNEINADENDPMYNRCIQASEAPGSTFKLCTGLAALAEGVLTLDEHISDMGAFYYTNTVNPAKCWTTRYYNHANQTIVEGLKNSCNYFFYTCAYRLGIDRLYEWSAALGLTTKTNIELPYETMSIVGNQENLYDPAYTIKEQKTYKPLIVYYSILYALQDVIEARGMDVDSETLENVVLKLMNIAVSYTTKEDWYTPIRETLQYDFGLPREYITNHYMVNTMVVFLQELFWTQNETIMVGIGQSITQVTPISVATYTSAITNYGTVYEAQIVDKVISATGIVELEKAPEIRNHIDTDRAYFDAIHRGMEEVTSTENDGTAAKQFANAKYKIAAKTGTSQNSEIDVENNAWLVTYAPYDADPEIVVIVFIPNGYAGARSADAAIDTIEYYLDNLYGDEHTTFGGEFKLSD